MHGYLVKDTMYILIFLARSKTCIFTLSKEEGSDGDLRHNRNLMTQHERAGRQQPVKFAVYTVCQVN